MPIFVGPKIAARSPPGAVPGGFADSSAKVWIFFVILDRSKVKYLLSAAALLAGCYEDAGELGVDTATRIALSPAEIGFTADGKTMDDYFDAVFLSYELHELKPSEAIFRKMIAAGGMRPEETLFIDDGQKNVDAAQRLGFAVYMPGPGEDFGHILDNLNRYEEIL